MGVTLEEGETFASLHARVRDAAASMMRSAQPGTMAADASRRINTVLNFIRADFGTFAALNQDNTDQRDADQDMD